MVSVCASVTADASETAESAYKARRQPRVPFLAGSNSADTAGNRVRATTKAEFFARLGK